MPLYFIAHRGNVLGRNEERENKEDYILECLKQGYDCEIDVWVIDNEIFLGHDGPEHKTSIEFIIENKKRLWIHCKNYHALQYLLKVNVNCFFHDKDEYTITSKGVIWGNINSVLISGMICVMPEKYDDKWSVKEFQKCVGVCSDYISIYKSEII